MGHKQMSNTGVRKENSPQTRRNTNHGKGIGGGGEGGGGDSLKAENTGGVEKRPKH